MLDQPANIEHVQFIKDSYQKPFCLYPQQGLLESNEAQIFDGWITFVNISERNVFVKVSFSLPNGYFVQLIDEDNQVNYSKYISMHKTYRIVEDETTFKLFE